MNQNLRVNKTNFHVKGFALGLALKQRRNATRKSPILLAEGFVVNCSNHYFALQVNFFNDHTKVVLLPRERDVLFLYIDGHRHGTTYLLSDLVKVGCTIEVFERLTYCRKVLKTLLGLEDDV